MYSTVPENWIASRKMINRFPSLSHDAPPSMRWRGHGIRGILEHRRTPGSHRIAVDGDDALRSLTATTRASALRILPTVTSDVPESTDGHINEGG
jgi:hypothetical protein